MISGAVRRILKIQLGTKPMTRRDMEELRTIILELQMQLNAIIDRISGMRISEAPSSPSNRSLSFSSRSPVETRSSETELPGDGPTGCAEQYHSPVLVAFHKWARILLSLFIDKAYCVAYQPFLKNAKSRIWPAARQRYVSSLDRVRVILIQVAHSAIAMALWRSSSHWLLILISNRFNGAGLGE